MRLAAALAVIVPLLHPVTAGGEIELAVSRVSEMVVREGLQTVGFEPPEAG